MPRAFWAHYCPAERGILWVGRDEACNWCGLACDPVLEDERRDAERAPSPQKPDATVEGRREPRRPRG